VTADVTQVSIVDSFAERPFEGNRAGVCVLDARTWPDENWMRNVAGELSSETAFVYPLNESSDTWALRWFTAVAESNVCGHATLAAAQILHAIHREVPSFTFHSPYGTLTAQREEDGVLRLEFPAAFPVEIAIPAGLAQALGLDPLATFETGSLGDLLIRVAEETQVRGLQPDTLATMNLCRSEAIRGLIVTAPADTADSGYDFVSRYFSPAEDLYEDPVTGSAHTALSPYWASELGRQSLTGLQASTRSGLVRTELADDRVFLLGRAIITVTGLMHVAPPGTRPSTLTAKPSPRGWITERAAGGQGFARRP
jgi:PhzF family phenazine biosynthesis protein